MKADKRYIMSKQNDFIKKLMTLVLPIAFQQFMLALVSASDALMLGALSQDALAAVSLASQIAFVQNLFLACLPRNIGEKAKKRKWRRYLPTF